MGIVEYLGKLVSLKVVMGVGELFLFSGSPIPGQSFHFCVLLDWSWVCDVGGAAGATAQTLRLSLLCRLAGAVGVGA